MKLLNRYYGFIIIFIFGFFPLLPLFQSGLPITHDGQDHVARIANFYQSLSEGNIIPRWAGNLNWGYGHPILMFLYPFPSYFVSLFHLIGFSLVDSVKIVFGFSFILSGATMYLWMRNVLGEKAGIVAGVLYMLSPYRFVDLYVRGAIGEHIAFIFAPLIFYFILKFRRSIFDRLGFSVSIALLLFSHNALAIMFLTFAMLYAMLIIYKAKNKLLLPVNYLLFTVLGLGLCAFFLIPAFLEGKYTLRDIVTGGGEYKSSFVNFKDFFIPSWSYGGTQALSKQIGLVHILAILISFFTLKKIREDKKFSLYILSALVLVISLFLMTSYSDFIWQNLTLIQKFQFPWRLLSLTVFSTAILSSFSVFIFKSIRHMDAFIILLCTLCLVIYFPYFKANGYLKNSESFYTGVYKSTTDTGESSPIWAVRFMEKESSRPAEFISGTGIIEQISRNSTTRVYKIETRSENSRIRENTLYFPNWEVRVNGVKTGIEFQDPKSRGLITYIVPKGKNIIEIKFKDTKLRTLSNIISVVSNTIFVILLIYSFKFKKK